MRPTVTSTSPAAGWKDRKSPDLARQSWIRRGGEAHFVAATEDLYHSSRARLKWAQGDLEECLCEYEAAVAAAERRVSALLAIDGDAGGPADGELKLVAARGRLAELKIFAERVSEALRGKGQVNVTP